MGFFLRKNKPRRRKQTQSYSHERVTPNRKVRFSLQPNVYRPPGWDERFVVLEFEQHIATCPICCCPDFSDRWRRPRIQSMCRAGHNLAHSLLDYLYAWRGRVYSAFETHRTSPVEILWNEKWTIARTLLVSVEHGLQVGHLPNRKSYSGLYC